MGFFTSRIGKDLNYYSFHIGDYRRDTSHLSLLEHGVYRQLLDWLYLDQKPIPEETETVCRRLSARTDEEKKAVEIVLKEFFEVCDGYIQRRVMREIEAYEAKATQARMAGKLGGRPKKTEAVISDNRDESERKANHKPLTINQEPIKERRERATRIPANFPDDESKQFCKTERPELDVEQVAARFRDHWKAVPKGSRLDWMATWRNWVRGEKTQARPYQQAPPRKTARDLQIETYQKLTGYPQNESIEG